MGGDRWIKGAVLRIPLSDGRAAYCQMLQSPEMAFFASESLGEPLFRLWVHKAAYSTGRWIRLMNMPVHPALEEAVPRFKKDPVNQKLSLYFPGGKEVPAEPEQCKGLERAAVWDAEHVEERLEAYLEGRPS